MEDDCSSSDEDEDFNVCPPQVHSGTNIGLTKAKSHHAGRSRKNSEDIALTGVNSGQSNHALGASGSRIFGFGRKFQNENSNPESLACFGSSPVVKMEEDGTPAFDFKPVSKTPIRADSPVKKFSFEPFSGKVPEAKGLEPVKEEDKSESNVPENKEFQSSFKSSKTPKPKTAPKNSCESLNEK